MHAAGRAAITLRPAATADAPALATLYLAARAAAVPGLSQPWAEPDVVRWMIETLVERHTVRVACMAEEIVAYIGWGEGVVRHLYVAPSRLGQGIGTTLLDTAKAASDGRLCLYCLERNHRARAFYRREGFQEGVPRGVDSQDDKEPDIRLTWAAGA